MLREFHYCRVAVCIRLDLGPDDAAFLVDHLNSRVRNAVDLLAFISGIAQSVGVDDPMIRVGKNWEVDFTLAVSGNLLRKALGSLGWIDANRIEFHLLTLL